MTQDELTSEIFLSFDGDLTPVRMDALGVLLQKDPAALKLYYSLAQLHNALEIRMRSQRANEARGVIPIDRILYLERRRRLKLSAAAAVFIMFSFLTVLWWQNSNQDMPTHAFYPSPGAQYAVTFTNRATQENPVKPGTLSTGARLVVVSGTVECWFKEGVHAMFQGPCDLTVTGDNSIKFNEGTGWFHVPPGAEGFTVTTPEIEVTDLGTEFGILSQPKNRDEIHVFAGKVRVNSRGLLKKKAILSAGKSYYADPFGRLVPISGSDTFPFAKLANNTNRKQPENMKNKITTLSVLAAASVANGAVIARFDFGEGAAQSGFTQITTTTATAGVTSGGITASLTNGGGSRDRTTSMGSTLPPFTYNRLLSTLIFGPEQNSPTPSVLTVSGLNPALIYQVQIWSHDASVNNGISYTFTSPTTGASGSVLNSLTGPTGPGTYTDNNVYSFKTANITGVSSINWTLGVSGTLDNNIRGRVNGVEITTIPETSSSSLLILAALGLMRRRR